MSTSTESAEELNPAALMTADIAEMMNVSTRSVYTWAKTMDLPHYDTPGGHMRFRAAEVKKWLEGRGLEVPEKLVSLCGEAA